MKFFILVFIPLILAACLTVVGHMILGIKGALAGGLAGAALLVLGLIIFIKDRKSGSTTPATSAPPAATPPPKKEESPKEIKISRPTEIKKTKIKKPKKGDKRVPGILKNAQALVKEVSVDPETSGLLIDATIVPTTQDGAYAPWFPDEIIFRGFSTEEDAEKSASGQEMNFSGWKRWVQNEFRLIDLDILRGSCRLQYALPSVPAGVRFIRFSYENECFGKVIALPSMSASAPSPAITAALSPEPAAAHPEREVEAPEADIEQEPGEILVFVLRNGEQTGPFTMSDLWVEIAEHRVFLTDYGWYDGLPEWLPISQLIEHDKDSI